MTEAKIARMQELRAQGWTQRSIAAELGGHPRNLDPLVQGYGRAVGQSAGEPSATANARVPTPSVTTPARFHRPA
jgi:hypothetical protein